MAVLVDVGYTVQRCCRLRLLEEEKLRKGEGIAGERRCLVQEKEAGLRRHTEFQGDWRIWPATGEFLEHGDESGGGEAGTGGGNEEERTAEQKR